MYLYKYLLFYFVDEGVHVHNTALSYSVTAGTVQPEVHDVYVQNSL